MRSHIEPGRILSRAACEALFQHILSLGTSQTKTTVTIRSLWTGNVRWGRNRPTTSGDTTESSVVITRRRDRREVTQLVSRVDETSLRDAIQTIDQKLATGDALRPDSSSVNASSSSPLDLLSPQHYLAPTLWSEATATMRVPDLSAAVHTSVTPVVTAGLLATGYGEVSAASWAIFNTNGLAAYAAATGALYTETVRNAAGSASGWAGQSQLVWDRLDPAALSTIARQHCIDSANPVAIEPGRYTAILMPEVAGRLLHLVVGSCDFSTETEYSYAPFFGPTRAHTKLGTKVLDTRITITSDAMDAECSFIPFDAEGNPYRRVTWIENGVLKELAYNRAYAQQTLHTDVALPNPEAFRVNGGPTSMEEMIATTDRGILVANIGGLSPIDIPSITIGGITRNGLWLIEHGKITRSIKNMYFDVSVLGLFNRVVQIGPAVRIYGAGGGEDRSTPPRALAAGHIPIVAPTVKVEDFNFTRLTDAI